jgi:hypothetical protein
MSTAWSPGEKRSRWQQINAPAFSPDGTTLASCDRDGAIELRRAGPIRPVPYR